jgi:tRNA(Ile2) C34 agmatinyltransferase TiaS
MPVCKYCGKEIKQSGAKGWFAAGTGWNCPSSPTNKHEMPAGDKMICKYCGKSVKASGANGLFADGTGWNCANSPNKKHCLP